MWLLKGIDGNANNFCLIPRKEYIVGRKACDLLLPNDASISRKHATIKIEASSSNAFKIALSDFSKYGVTVNGKRVSSVVHLTDGDEILFGQCQHKFRLIHQPLVVAMSCINNSEKKSSVKAMVNELGGNVANEWNNNCTHLVMEEVTFTVKTVCALAKGCPIVTPKFLEDCVESCKEPSKAVVDAANYFPEIAEPSLKGKEDHFRPNEERKRLFFSKNFIFLSKKQFKRLAPAVQMASGKVVLCDNPDETTATTVGSDDSIVLAPEAKDEKAASRDQTQWIKCIMDRLKMTNLRSIKESEVGLAILNVSLETYCNPRSSPENSIAGTTNSQIIQDTLLDFTSQWHSTYKDKSPEPVKPAAAPEFRRPSILASDSQYDGEKKRKRSSETSMYITDTVPLETLPCHLAKRARKKTSDSTCSEDKISPDRPGKATYEKRNTPVVPDSLCNKSLIDESRKHVVLNTVAEPDSSGMDVEGNMSISHRHHQHDSASTSRVSFIQDSKIDSSGWKSSIAVANSDMVNKKEDMNRSETFNNNDDPFEMRDDIIATNTEVSSRWGENSKTGVTDKSRVAESQCTEYLQDDVNRGSRDVESKPVETDFIDRTERLTKDHNVNLFGFLSTKMPKPKIEAEDELNEIDYVDATTVVKFTSLVKRNAPSKQITHHDITGKNFKKFRKAHYPGKDLSIPNVIGGRDLMVFQTEDENKKMAFAELRAVDEERDRHEKYIDDLFNWNSDNPRRRKR